MPVQPCEADGQKGYQYGPSGKCYVYPSGDETARKEAKRKAHVQGAAIEVAGGKAVGTNLNNSIGALPQGIKGLYLVAPHGRLVSDGTKTAVVKAKPRPALEGRWVVVSKEDGYGWAFGLADLGPAEELAAADFKARYAEHQVGEGDRLRWWQDADPLYLYPVTGFKAFEQPVEVVVPPGTQTVMRAVEASAAKDASVAQDEKTHSRSRCMNCSQPPQIQVRWADGRGGAWFCIRCFKKWADEEDREIVTAWALPDGQAADKPKDEGLPSITVRGHTPQELARMALGKVGDTKTLTAAAPAVCPACSADVGPVTEAGLVCPECGARLRAGTVGGTAEGVSYDDKSYADKAYDGVYLLMFLEDADADAIAGQVAKSGIENAEPAEHLHVTVASLGELDSQRLALARGALWAQAQVLPPVEGALGGVGKFGKPGDEEAPFYAVFDAPGLDAFRGRLLAALAAMGIEPDGDHGYSPHVTLAYGPYEQAVPALRGRKLRLRTLSLSYDGDTVDYRLEGKAGKKGDGGITFEKAKDSPREESEGGKGMGDTFGDTSGTYADGSDFVFIDEGKADKALLPLAPRERAWDAGAAVARVRGWAGAEDAPNAKYASAFMWHDPARAAEFEAYKLPFVDVVDGRAMAVPRGVFAVNQRLQQTHMPEEAKEAVKRKVSAYYAQMRSQWEDPTLKPAWEEGKKGALDALLEKGQAFLGALKDAFAPQDASAATDGGESMRAAEQEFTAIKAEMERRELPAPKVVVEGYALPEADFGALTGWLEGKKGEAQQMGGFAFKARDGRDWWFQWTTNAFIDRQGEIFTTASLDDCIARNAEHDVKGQFWFWHMPGTKFGDIRWQARVGRFLVEAGPFDETPMGQAFKGIFQAYPYGHPVVSPEGWGTSHGFFYSRSDREDGVFERFAKKESTVLPARYASNLHNPQPFIIREVSEMEEHQRAALEALGGKEFVAQIVTGGEQRTKQLEEAGIAFKSVDEEGQPETTADKLRAIADAEEDAGVKSAVLAVVSGLEAATKADADAEAENEEEDEEAIAGAATTTAEEEEEKESEKSDCAEDEEEETEKEAPVPLTRQEVADAISGVVDTLRDETATAVESAVKSVIGQITQELAPLVDTVAEMKRADDERLGEKAQETPAASLHDLIGRAIGSKVTKLTKNQVKKAEKGGPAETAPVDNGPVRTGVPLIDAFINEGFQG